MKSPRMTMRRLMALVAVVAIALGSLIEVQRRRARGRYLRQAEACAQAADKNLELAADHEDHASWAERADVVAWLRQEAALERRLASDLRALERWNRRAASRPWPSPDGPYPTPR